MAWTWTAHQGRGRAGRTRLPGDRIESVGQAGLAVFQQYGYGPTRFLRAELVDAFAASLRPEDRLWFLDIFHAGGTAKRDISSADLVAEIAARGATAEASGDREALVSKLVEIAEPGDLILVMGARDPSLTELCLEILRRLG